MDATIAKSVASAYARVCSYRHLDSYSPSEGQRHHRADVVHLLSLALALHHAVPILLATYLSILNYYWCPGAPRADCTGRHSYLSANFSFLTLAAIDNLARHGTVVPADAVCHDNTNVHAV